MARKLYPVGLLALALALVGCKLDVYQSDRTLRAIHIFGVGWISESTSTNQSRTFGIGLVNSVSRRAVVVTNAPVRVEFPRRRDPVRIDRNPVGITPKAPTQ